MMKRGIVMSPPLLLLLASLSLPHVTTISETKEKV